MLRRALIALLATAVLGSAGAATAEARLRLPIQVARFKAIQMTAAFARRMDAKGRQTGRCRRDSAYRVHCNVLVDSMPRGNYCVATAVVRMDRRNHVGGRLRDVSCG